MGFSIYLGAFGLYLDTIFIYGVSPGVAKRRFSTDKDGDKSLVNRRRTAGVEKKKKLKKFKKSRN